MKFEEALAALRQGKKIRIAGSRHDYLFLSKKDNIIYHVYIPDSFARVVVNPFTPRDSHYLSQYLLDMEWDLFECDDCCFFCSYCWSISKHGKVHCIKKGDPVWSLTPKKTDCDSFEINKSISYHDDMLDALRYPLLESETYREMVMPTPPTNYGDLSSTALYAHFKSFCKDCAPKRCWDCKLFEFMGSHGFAKKELEP